MLVHAPEYLCKFLPLRCEFSEYVKEGGKLVPKNGFHAVEDILCRGLIHYSDPNTFNDPFEMEGVRILLSAQERERSSMHAIAEIQDNPPQGFTEERLADIVRLTTDKDFEAIEEEQDKDKTTLLYRCGYISLSTAKELLSKVVFGHLIQAATWSISDTSIPSLNLTPVITLAR